MIELRSLGNRIGLFALLLCGTAAGADLPTLPPVSPTLAAAHAELVAQRKALVDERSALRSRTQAHNGECDAVEEGSAAEANCTAALVALSEELDRHIKASQRFIAALAAVATPEASAYFYSLQSRTLTPMNDGGHPIDAAGSPPTSLHGLVGGTTWTFGFQWPRKACDPDCVKDVERNLADQLALYCSSQAERKKCLEDGLPFTKESYDLVVSMGSAHSAIEDLATRAVWDGASFGEYSRTHKEIFASLKDRQFDTLDCHSNGAMLCLAALRSGDTSAKKVRLFGPQINPQAAALWGEWAADNHTTIEVFINKGDPVPAISWKQPTPQTPMGKAATAAWMTNPLTGPATVADALMHTWIDSQSGTMDGLLGGYGLTVKRMDSKSPKSSCDSPDIRCHSMRVYEENAGMPAAP